jgi:hypothetical protein
VLFAIDLLFWLFDPRAWRTRFVQIGVGAAALAAIAARAQASAPQARARRDANHLKRQEQVRRMRERSTTE